MSDYELAICALSDQIQEACNASGLPVVGFTIIVDNPAINSLTTESRARIERRLYIKALRDYVEAEEKDQREDEVSS